MSGTGNYEDQPFLGPGRSCIIVVDDVNSPTGIWWGKVVETNVSGSPGNQYLQVEAQIDGGAFRLALDIGRCGDPIRSDEYRGQTPRANYRVYPDTATTRQLFQQIITARAETCMARDNAKLWRRAHLETVEHLARLGLVSRDETATPPTLKKG